MLNYIQYLTETVSMSIDMVVEILNSLQGSDNEKLVNKLVNYSDKNGKSVLMSLVQNNKSDLIDKILKYDIDINHKDKYNQNVLFYCKNIETFKNLYDKGADPTLVSKRTKKNTINYLASKGIFNQELYERLIRDGVYINGKDKYGASSFDHIVLYVNLRAARFFIENGVKLNKKENVFKKLIYTFNHFPNKRKSVISLFKMLFDNGEEIEDIEGFVNELSWITREVDVIEKFIIPLSGYLDEEFFIEYFKKIMYRRQPINGVIKILETGVYYKLYNYLKNIYEDDFYKLFKDYIEKHPYMEHAGKFNL